MSRNSAQFSKVELSELFGAENTRFLPELRRCIGISTDTRTLVEGNLFVALKGENFDGHSLVYAAFERGAGGAIIQRDYASQLPSGLENFPLILVENTLSALGKLANFHRRRFSIPIVAVAGAAGKTTTKEMIARVLSQKFQVLKTEGNLNNQIGVPHTLLRLSEHDAVGVIEIGTNEPGEIEILSDIVQPTHGIITNIGKEHLEKLIDLDGVEREETALFRYLFAHNGRAFVNADDERLRSYSSPQSLSYSFSGGADILAKSVLNDFTQPKITIHFGDTSLTAQLQTLGEISAQNALAAASVGFALGLTAEEIRRGLEEFSPEVSASGYARMALEQFGGIALLNDCYNANPESMTAALATLSAMKTAGKKIAVLGDMRELGEAAFAEHTALLRLVSEVELSQFFTLQTDWIFLVGEEMNRAFSAEKTLRDDGRFRVFASREECADALAGIVSAGDIVLVKGSRGMKMEEIIRQVKEKLCLLT